MVIALFLKRSIGALFGCLLVVWMLAFSTSAAAAESVTVSAEAAVVCCVENGQVLYQKNGREPLAMASTTKIMTALLTLEAAAREDTLVTITEEMVAVEGSSMGLAVGDRLPLSSLAKGMLLTSGNDAANAAAIAIGGNVAGFADLMNQRAAALGMEDTHFVTPSGLDDDDHYTTALDMAKLGAAAISNDSFRAICSQTAMGVAFETPSKTVTMTNHNRLLKLYDGCIGIKTGFTKKAGRCLVSAAERDGVTLVAVTLHAPDDWNDHRALLDYGFSQVEAVSLGTEAVFSLPVVGGVTDTVSVAAVGEPQTTVVPAGQTVAQTVELPRFVYAPVESGDIVGRLVYTVDGVEIASLPLAVSEPVEPAEKQEGLWKKAARWIVSIFAG